MTTTVDRLEAGGRPNRPPCPPRPSRRSWTSRARRSQLWPALLFLAPAAIALAVLRVAPTVSAIDASLHRTSLLAGNATLFVGWSNYDSLWHDPTFWKGVRVTLLFAVIINPLQIVAALAVAVLFTQRFVGARFWRTLVFLPATAPAAVATIVWGIAFQPDGLANGVLRAMGLKGQPFLTSQHQAVYAIIILLSWFGVGYWMMFLIAGLQDIPPSYYDAASVDGASWWQTFRLITLPLLRRPLAFVLVADTVANFLVFVPVQILTNGGPEGSTNLIMFDIYSRAYTNGDVNTADAEVVLLVLLLLIIVSIQFRLLRSRD